MLNKSQLVTILTLQDKMNSEINPNWLTAGYAYLRAAMVEAGEAMDPQYKWWKSGGLDLENTQVEHIDILHFIASHEIREHGGSIESAADHILLQIESDIREVTFDGVVYDIDSLDGLELLDLIAGLSAAKRVSWPLFFKACAHYELTTETLFKGYVGKNVLNMFRAKNGYKTGEYVKLWDAEGNEDNVYMKRAMDELDINSASFSDELYAKLESSYPG